MFIIESHDSYQFYPVLRHSQHRPEETYQWFSCVRVWLITHVLIHVNKISRFVVIFFKFCGCFGISFWTFYFLTLVDLKNCHLGYFSGHIHVAASDFCVCQVKTQHVLTLSWDFTNWMLYLNLKLLRHLLQHLSQLSHSYVFDFYFSVFKTLCSELLCIGVNIPLICMKRNLPLVNHDYKEIFKDVIMKKN